MLRLRQAAHHQNPKNSSPTTPHDDGGILLEQRLLDPEGHPPPPPDATIIHHHHHHSHDSEHQRKKKKMNPAVYRSSRASHFAAFVAGCAATATVPSLVRRVLWFHHGTEFSSSSSSSTCQISFGTYRGHEYHGPNQVGLPTCLVESKFLKVQQHHVRLPPPPAAAAVSTTTTGEEDPSSIIPDWLWIDYHDRINVLVEAPSSSSSSSDRRFLVFEQTKYALEGRMSLAVVGGIIEPGELPATAAQREIHEELHVVCQEYELLGRYRTDVNRGAGWTHAYLASQCSSVQKRSDADPEAARTAGPKTNTAVEVGAADTERQDVKVLTLPQLREAVREGRFLEIQWSATVALAILHLDAQHDPHTAR